jgi:hypothetical protein
MLVSNNSSIAILIVFATITIYYLWYSQLTSVSSASTSMLYTLLLSLNPWYWWATPSQSLSLNDISTATLRKQPLATGVEKVNSVVVVDFAQLAQDPLPNLSASLQVS